MSDIQNKVINIDFPIAIEKESPLFPLEKSEISRLYCIVNSSENIFTKQAIPGRIIFNELRKIATSSNKDNRILRYGYQTSAWAFYSPYIFSSMYTAIGILLVILGFILACFGGIDAFYFIGLFTIAAFFVLFIVIVVFCKCIEGLAVHSLKKVYQYNLGILIKEDLTTINRKNIFLASRGNTTINNDSINDIYYLKGHSGESCALSSYDQPNINRPTNLYKYIIV